jgi:hypothetical protein
MVAWLTRHDRPAADDNPASLLYRTIHRFNADEKSR